MKKAYRTIFVLLILFIMLAPAAYSQEDKSITILFTHDMHDNMYPFKLLENGETREVGGFAYLYSAIKKERKRDSELLLVDAGDFSMGTLFQTIFTTDSPELRMLGRMGYDVTTFGNHEFDFRTAGLAESLRSAKDSNDPLPEIVASNVEFPVDEKGKMNEEVKQLKEAMEYYGVKEYTIVEKKGIKIGIFGLMGKKADSYAPLALVEFTDQIERAKEMVRVLQEEGAELIVCLSHSGTSDNKDESEDEILAKEVPEIDVIISGHTHTTLEEPIIVGDTVIGSVGYRGVNLGVISVTKTGEGKWKLNRYELIPIDSSLPEDQTIKEYIDGFREIVQKKYLDRFNMEFDEVLAYSPFDFPPHSELGKKHDESTLGNLISDSFIYTVKLVEGENYEPVRAAVVPNGTIRSSFVKGNITVSDVFNVSSLGVGPDKVSGYPLVSAYLTGRELKAVAEVDASITPIMDVAQLYISGLNYTFNPHRLIFNKVTDIYLTGEDGLREEIKDDELYRIVAGLYSAQMLSVVGEKSFGLLSIVPKDKYGNPIENFDDHVITADGHEIKEWWALATYLKSFEKVKGIPQVPDYYSKTQGRKVVVNSRNIIELLKNPNSIALMIYGIVLVLIIAIVFIVMAIRKRRRRRRSKYIF